MTRRLLLTLHREIERLRDRVKELEGQLGSTTLDCHETEESSAIIQTLERPALPKKLDPLGQFCGNKAYYNCENAIPICES